MIITEYLTQKLQEYVAEKYLISDFNFEIIKTKKEFDGFYTVVLFPLIPRIKKSPKEISYEIVDYINSEKFIITSHNVIQSFLNLNFTSQYLINTLKNINPLEEFKSNNELKII